MTELMRRRRALMGAETITPEPEWKTLSGTYSITATPARTQISPTLKDNADWTEATITIERTSGDIKPLRINTYNTTAQSISATYIHFPMRIKYTKNGSTLTIYRENTANAGNYVAVGSETISGKNIGVWSHWDISGSTNSIYYSNLMYK